MLLNATKYQGYHFSFVFFVFVFCFCFWLAISLWNKFDFLIQNFERICIFKQNILKFIRTSQKLIFNCHNLHGIKLPTRLRLSLSDLRKHKFKFSVQFYLELFCNCRSGKTESSSYFLLHYSQFSVERSDLLNNIRYINRTILKSDSSAFTWIILFRDTLFNANINARILGSTFEYIILKEKSCRVFIYKYIYIYIYIAYIALSYYTLIILPYIT